MRLYDQLLISKGGFVDKAMLGSITAFCDELVKAQCFLMSPEIMQACSTLCRSKPSSILDAIGIARVPYPNTWVEWQPNQRPQNRENNKPIPSRLGCLLVADNNGSRGTAMFAWTHHDDHMDISLNPFGLVFDWSKDFTEPVIDQYAKALGIKHRRDDPYKHKDEYRKTMLNGDRWAKFADSEQEIDAFIQLDARAGVIPLQFCSPYLYTNKIVPGDYRYESYMEDLAGELPFIEAFLLLLNSRNSIVAQKRDDFVKLNKARAKHKKTPLKEFVTTTLKLTKVQQNRADSMGMSREMARAHIVRGHFKLRASGVYWWAPHMRGRGAPLPRHHYKVT